MRRRLPINFYFISINNITKYKIICKKGLKLSWEIIMGKFGIKIFE